MSTAPDVSAAAAWLLVLLTGAVAGAFGQLVRTIAGVGNANRALATGQPVEPYNVSRLVISLLVGATAGVLAALGMHEQLSKPSVEVTTILGLMAAGYAGADFIEGVAGKYFPTPAPAGSAPTPVTPSTVELKPLNTLDTADGAVG